MKKSNFSKPRAGGWIDGVTRDVDAEVRLFCFPHVGGAATVYRMWPQELSPSIDVCAIQLPGHGRRIEETPFKHWQLLIQELDQVLYPYLDRPFFFFGHSMGALLAFELARSIRRNHGLQPERLYVSALGAPHTRVQHAEPRHTLSDENLLKEFRDLGGTPQEILDHPELMQMFLPVLRADLEILETYEYQHDSPLDCPITCFGGTEDPEVEVEDLEAWRELTRNSFSFRQLSGDHFFIHSSRKKLLNILSADIKENLVA